MRMSSLLVRALSGFSATHLLQWHHHRSSGHVAEAWWPTRNHLYVISWRPCPSFPSELLVRCWYDVGTKFDDCGTTFDKLGTCGVYLELGYITSGLYFVPIRQISYYNRRTSYQLRTNNCGQDDGQGPHDIPHKTMSWLRQIRVKAFVFHQSPHRSCWLILLSC